MITLALSVAVECSFSRGCILISHLHNCLCPHTAQTLMCLGDWLHMDLISTANFIRFLARGPCEDGMATDQELVEDKLYIVD